MSGGGGFNLFLKTWALISSVVADNYSYTYLGKISLNEVKYIFKDLVSFKILVDKTHKSYCIVVGLYRAGVLNPGVITPFGIKCLF